MSVNVRPGEAHHGGDGNIPQGLQQAQGASSESQPSRQLPQEVTTPTTTPTTEDDKDDDNYGIAHKVGALFTSNLTPWESTT